MTDKAAEQVQRAYFLLSEALDLDEEGRGDEALEAYTQAVELCIGAKGRLYSCAHLLLLSKRQMFTFSLTLSHASTNATTRRHIYSQGMSGFVKSFFGVIF